MKFTQYQHEELEKEMRALWEEESVYDEVKKRGSGKEKFYFLDGPPYTSGKVHIGTAWNKTMKDLVVRFKRMQGFDVWDRAGYDMHGLPNEHASMRDLELQTKEDILEYGLDRFIKACKERAHTNMLAMHEDFRQLGVWLDFENAYQTMSPEWTDAVWWLIKTAHEKGRLYEGLRPMAWDPVHESACAKHELFYKEVEDKSIFVKFALTDESDTYLVIWTTTPWTIPFNLMIMANPDVEYAHVRVGDETWIMAKDLVQSVLDAGEVDGEIVKTLPGSELVGLSYTHFFADQMPYDFDTSTVHRVVASAQYVTTESGSGLVHAAPGCGPEDYEVGIQEGVPAFNLLDEQGRFPDTAGIFAGKVARTEDAYFTECIKEAGALVAVQPYVHDYPHAERSKAPVVYKTTKQWFFKIADLKDELVAKNNEVHWQPEAGFNAFTSWLENLRDNSITKQRFWGTPLPIWRNTSDADDVIVIGSAQELAELSGQEVADLHKPWIDEVEIQKDGKTYRRIPDVIDVWVDAGVASWACLGFPKTKESFDRFFPADFIIEGYDQIRGWFNLLMVASVLGHDVCPFKNVYMHGFINDSKGRKMSKSEGNYILPEEVLSKYGADATRFYFAGGTKPGIDLNYNFDDCDLKHRLLRVFWNVHKYTYDLLSEQHEPLDMSSLRIEDKYILTETEHAVKQVQELLDVYALDKIPDVVERLWMETSRTYIQLVRKRSDANVAAVLAYVLRRAITLLAPISPFVADAMWRNVSEFFDGEQSVHLEQYPKQNPDFVFVSEHDELLVAQDVISAILAARDSVQIGVRWPLGQVKVRGVNLSDAAKSLVADHTNVHSIELVDELSLSYDVKPNFRAIGKEFGQRTGEIASALKDVDASEQYAKSRTVNVLDVTLDESMLDATPLAPEGFALGGDSNILVLLDTAQTDELLLEGYQRELVRRIQSMRKDEGLDKSDVISIVLDESSKDLITDSLAETVGASKVSVGNPDSCPHMSSFDVRERSVNVGFHVDKA